MLAAKLLSATYTSATNSGTSWGNIFIRTNLFGVAYNQSNMYVAAGANGYILNSNNGTNWSASAVGSQTFNAGVVYVSASNRFIAAGGSAAFVRSSNGTTWTTTSGSMSIYASDIATDGTNTVVVGWGGEIRTSSSGGTAWSSPTSGTSNDFNGVAAGNARFVAVGAAGTIRYSVDYGATWLNGTCSSSLNPVAVVYSSTLIGGTGQWVAGTDSGAIVISTDNGVTFASSGTYSSGLISGAYITSITYEAGLFVVTQVSGGYGYISTTPNPATTAWTTRLTTPTRALYSVYWSGSAFWAVGLGASIYTSADGITWTVKDTGTLQDLNGSAWNGSGSSTGTVVAVGDYGTILTSTDLKTWTTATSGTTQNLNGVAWSESVGRFVAVGNSGTILRSTDGTSWTASTSGVAVNLNAVIYDTVAAAFWAVGNSSTLLKSTDGISWTASSVGALNLKSITSNQTDRLVIAATNTETYYSTTGGASWNTVALAGTHYRVRWNGARFIVSGSGGAVNISTDATSWTAGTSGTVYPLYGIAANPTWMVLAGGAQYSASVIYAGLTSTSFAGASNLTSIQQALKSVEYVPSFDGRMLAVGEYGQIAVSPAFSVSDHTPVI